MRKLCSTQLGVVAESRWGVSGLAVPVPLGLYLGSNLSPLLSQHEELSIDLILRDGVSDLIEDGLDLHVRLGLLDD
jgi:DNA-binding transcriptional LysR family regulator